jgi:hypothetical protein
METGEKIIGLLSKSFSNADFYTYRPQTDILPDLFSQWYGPGLWYACETHSSRAGGDAIFCPLVATILKNWVLCRKKQKLWHNALR